MTSNITDEMRAAIAEFKGEITKVPRHKRALPIGEAPNWRKEREASFRRYQLKPGPKTPKSN